MGIFMQIKLIWFRNLRVLEIPVFTFVSVGKKYKAPQPEGTKKSIEVL